MSFPDPWALPLRKRQVPLPPGEGRGEQGGAERPQILDLSPSLRVGLASATQSGIPGFWLPRLSRLHSCLLSWSCQAAVFASEHICALPLLGPSTWHRLSVVVLCWPSMCLL